MEEWTSLHTDNSLHVLISLNGLTPNCRLSAILTFVPLFAISRHFSLSEIHRVLFNISLTDPLMTSYNYSPAFQSTTRNTRSEGCTATGALLGLEKAAGRSEYPASRFLTGKNPMTARVHTLLRRGVCLSEYAEPPAEIGPRVRSQCEDPTG
jgi:hypothetical protein